MEMDEIRQRAFNACLSEEELSNDKGDLIRQIQSREGCYPCFGARKWLCNNEKCVWRIDCQGTIPPFYHRFMVVGRD